MSDVVVILVHVILWEEEGSSCCLTRGDNSVCFTKETVFSFAEKYDGLFEVLLGSELKGFILLP